MLQLSVVVPTFNERDNVTTLFRRLETALAGFTWEVIFVDDNSPDLTWDVVRGLARQDSRVRCIRRSRAIQWSSRRRSYEASTSPLKAT